MNRRGFLAGSLPLVAAGGAVAAPVASVAGADLADAATLLAQMQAGKTSAEKLTRQFLRRIQEIDRRGPRLASVIELNPEALAQARQLDAERRKGRLRGPLHGLPVLLKDNIATGDKMCTSAGSLALAGLKARRDAYLVQRLREAGAVILGKTNLSEWANFRSTRSSSGWSSRGGQTLNPHALTRSPSGSSSGSGAAVAAGLCVFAVGTETDGSIVSPANRCGIVGLKPTLGLVSRDGVIPIAASQDTPGPMARSVADAALLLQALAGRDARDAATAAAPELPDYRAALRTDALKGARIGVVRNARPPLPQVGVLFEAALQVLREQGAELVEGLQIPNRAKYLETEGICLHHEFKDGLPRYLAEFQPDAPFRDLAELIAWNQQHADRAMPYFAQELFLTAQSKGDLQSAEYREALATNQRYARTEGLDALFAEHRLDAVVSPTGDPACRIDHLLGDYGGGSTLTGPFAVAGYPHITVPMGQVSGMPVGLSLGTLAWQEAKLLGLAHAYEQASRHYRAPRFLKDAG
ncbi:amidase [Pelomonas sp. SE-A7]|uniref:amidase n=1 Tax=Pelomonas sp. SE-A7 TaxID=3054953 RepID=UPI00259C8ECA|nr:amidase [Pelomonas sp. SE-A7]MDM4767925.1 amidase [Pelomonas sp. SE-A7]